MKPIEEYIELAKRTDLPVIVDGTRKFATGKSTLCRALRDAGIEAFEPWEFEEGIKKQDKDAYLLILLNDPIANDVKGGLINDVGHSVASLSTSASRG